MGAFMLACDLLLQVRASRSVSGEQIRALDRMVFGAGKPSRENLDLILLIDRYVQRADPNWGALLARAALASLVAGPDRAEEVAFAHGCEDRVPVEAARAALR